MSTTSARDQVRGILAQPMSVERAREVEAAVERSAQAQAEHAARDYHVHPTDGAYPGIWDTDWQRARIALGETTADELMAWAADLDSDYPERCRSASGGDE